MGKKRQILLLLLALSTGAILAGGGVFYLWHNTAPNAPTIAKVIRKIGPMRKKNVKKSDIYLYFSDKSDTQLIAEERTLFHPDSPIGLSESIIQALIEGSLKGLGRTLPKETVVNAVYITNSGLAYVDLSETIRNHFPGGCQTEYLAIYSIVNALVLNVHEINQVKILIGGHERQTLAGHIMLDVPFTANMYLVR